MVDDVQSEKPDSINFQRRWFVKGLISGVTGLALATGATSSAFAKKRRKGGGGGAGHGQPKPARTPGKRRRHG
jgi:hypothetical protein